MNRKSLFYDKYAGLLNIHTLLAFQVFQDSNIVEDYFSTEMKKHYKDRHVIYGRCAHLTESKPQFIEQGRGLCMSRKICQRGCPLGGYFNANSTLIPWALKTGNLTLKPDSVVHSVLYDEAKQKAIVLANIEESQSFLITMNFINV